MAFKNMTGRSLVGNDSLLGLGEINPATHLDEGDGKPFAFKHLGSLDSSEIQTAQGRLPKPVQRILGDNYHPEFTERTQESRLAANQTVGGQFVNFLTQAAVGEVVGGTLEGAGYLAAMKGPTMFADESEQTLGKMLVETGKALRTWGQEEAPIYTDPDQPAFAPNHWSWWMKNGTSVASTLSLMIPAAGAAKGISMFAKMAGFAEELGIAGMAGLSTLSQATSSRYMENMMEASGIYKEVYDDSVRKGMSKADAVKKASIAASTTYKRDWAMLGMDIMQYALLTKGVLRGESDTSTALGRMFGKTKSELAINPLKSYATEVAGEAFEEGFQWVATEEGRYAAEKAFNPSVKGEFSDRMGQYLKNGEMWTNAFFGGFGGAVFNGIHDTVDNLMSKGDGQVEEVKQWATNLHANLKMQDMAASLGDEYLSKQAKTNTEINLGIRAASAQMRGQSNEWLDAITNGKLTDDDLQKLGLSRKAVDEFVKGDVAGTKANIQAAADRYLNNLKEISKPNSTLAKALNKVYENRIKDQDGMSIESYARLYAALLTNAELQLDKAVVMQNEVGKKIESTLTRIPNFNKLSLNKQYSMLHESRSKVWEKQKSFIEKRLENDELDENIKKDLTAQLKQADARIDTHKKLLDELKESYTEEDRLMDTDPTTNADFDIDSIALEEWQNLESVDARLGSSIKGLQESIKRYKEGNISSAKNKSDFDFLNDEAKPDEEGPYVPELNDVVAWLDENNESHLGIVDSFDNKDDSNVYVKEVDDEYREVGKGKLLKLKADLELADRPSERDLDKFDVEPISSESFTPEDEYRIMLENTGINQALADLVNSLSTSHIDKTAPSNIRIRDEFFDAYLSDPTTTLKEAVATYEIDWSNKFWDEGDKTRREFRLKYQDKKVEGDKAINELIKLLTIKSGNEKNFSTELVDKLPIKVAVSIESQNKTFNKELYVHDSDFWNVNIPLGLEMKGEISPETYVLQQRQNARSFRYQIITNLLRGNSVKTSGLKKGRGWFNVVKTHGNIHDRLGVERGSLKLFVAIKQLSGVVEIASSPREFDIFGKPNKLGGVYFKTNKTCDGKEVLVKVNPSKITAEHADILFEAIRQRYTKGQGYKSKSKDSRVKGLTTQEVINMLVLFGDRATNPEHSKNKDKMPDYLRNKALYVHHEKDGRSILHFGIDGVMDLFDKDIEAFEANRQSFIEWATKNKNYRIPLGFKSGSLKGFELNTPFEKKFSIGDLVNDGTRSWAEILMDYSVGSDKNGTRYAIMTNLDRVKNPTTGEYVESITHSPLVDLNIRSLEVKEAPKETPKPIEEKVVKPGVKEVKKDVKVGNKQGITVEQLANLTAGTTLFYKSSLGTLPFATIGLSMETGKKFLDLNKMYHSQQTLHNLRSITLTPNRQGDIDTLVNWFTTTGPISWEEPDTSTDSDVTDPDDISPIGSFGKEHYTIDHSRDTISGKELDWFYKRFGKQNVKLTDKLISIAGNIGKHYFGAFSTDCIRIFEGAPGEVLYHESFHRVSLAYFYPEEREAVYKSARKKYNMPNSTDLEIEEKLADEFMIYKVTNAKPKSRSILQAIVDLYDFVVSFFTGHSKFRGDDIDRLFASIERGKFRFSKVAPANIKAAYDKEYGYEIGGKDIATIENLQDLKDITRALASVLLHVNDVKNINDVPKIDFTKLWYFIDHPKDLNKPDDRGGIIQQFRAARAAQEKIAANTTLSQEKRAEAAKKAARAARLAELYESVINPEYIGIFHERIESALMSYNISRVETDEDDTESGVSTETERFTKAMYEFNVRDNVLASIKFLIATLPASPEVNEATNTINHVDFNEAWESILFDTWHLETIEEMIEALESKPEIYYYGILAQKLRAGDDMLRSQFKISLSKHRHRFINFLFSRSRQTINREEGIYKTAYTYESSRSDMFSASRMERLSWNQAFYESDYIDRTTTKPKLNAKKIKELVDEYNNYRITFATEYNKLNGVLTATEINDYLSGIVPILAKVGIMVDRKILLALVDRMAVEDKLTKGDALKATIVSHITGIFRFLEDQSKLKETSVPLNKLLMPFKDDEKMLRYLSEVKFNVYPDLINLSILGPGGNQFFTYSQNTYLSDVVKKLGKHKHLVERKLSKIWNTRSKFLKQLLDDSTRSQFKLATFSAFIQKNASDSGRDYVSINRLEDYLVKMAATQRGLAVLPTLADKSSYFFFDGLKTIDFTLDFDEDGNAIFPDEVLELFLDYAKDERDRIDRAKADIKSYNEEQDPKAKKAKLKKLVSNYHYQQNGDVIATNIANATKYLLFPSFNNGTKFEGGVFDFNRDAKKEIEKVLLNSLNEELKYATKIGIIGSDIRASGRVIPSHNIFTDDAVIMDGIQAFGDSNKSITNAFANHMIKTMQSGIEFTKLVSGDPAFKKGIDRGGVTSVEEDYVKRYSGALSTGDVTDNESRQYGITGKFYNVATMVTQSFNLLNMYHDNIYKHIHDMQLERGVIDVKDAYIDYQIDQALAKYNKETEQSITLMGTREEKRKYVEDNFKAKIEDITSFKPGKQIEILKDVFNINLKAMLKGYKEIDSTDGQAWISPDMYRSLNARIGNWSDDKEEAFKLLQSEEILTPEQYAKSLNVVLQPLKIVSYGLMEDGDLEVPIFDKMSMATIFRQMGRFGHNVKSRIELMELLDRMEGKGEYKDLTPVQMVKITKVAKTGDKPGFKFYKDKNLSEVNKEGLKEMIVSEQPYELSRRQLLTDPHDQSRTKAGTQMIKMAFADILMQEEIYSNPLFDEVANRKMITGEEIVDTLTRCLASMSDKGTDRIKKRLGYKDGKIDLKALVKMLKRDSIKSGTADLIVDAFKMEGDEMYLDLDAFPNRKYLFSRLISMLAKEIIDTKLPGNQFIQFSQYGIRVNSDDELKWSDVVEENGGKRVVEMECYVSINLFKNVIPNYDELSWLEKRKFVLDNADSIMGYRIPTQGQNSVFVLKVKDVYPETIGDVITLPAAFTTLTGSDFDIDKVYVMRDNYTVVDGKLHKVQFHKTLEGAWSEIANKYNYLYRMFDEIDQLKLDEPEVGDSSQRVGEYGKIKNPDRLVKYIERLAKRIDDDMLDPTIKESILYELTINIQAGYFRKDLYEQIKSLVGTDLDKKREAFFEEYKGVTDPYVFNGRMAVENLLMSGFKSVYLSVGHIRQTMTPLGASVVAIKDLAKVIHKYDDVASNIGLGMFSPARQSNIKSDYIGGKNGIGPFALNNVHHAISQVAGIKFRNLTSDGLLNEDDRGNIDLSAINGKDKLSIMSWLSALIDVHVDIAKDPFVVWLNLNSATYDVTALMVRAGFGIDTFKFISQPIVKLYAEYMTDSLSDARISRFKDKRQVINAVKTIYKDRLKEALGTASEDKLAKVREFGVKELMNGEEMMKNIETQKDNANDPVWLTKQLQYFDIFLKYSDAGKQLSELVQASQLDTKKFGKSITSVIEFKDRIDRVLTEDRFTGLDKLFSTSKENPSFLGAYYNNFLGFGLNILSDLTIYSTPVFNQVLNEITTLTGSKFSGDKKLQDTIADELMGCIFAKFFNDQDFVGLDTNKVGIIMKEVSRIITDLRKSKDPADQKLFRENSLVKLLSTAPLDEALSSQNLPFESMLIVPNKDLSDKFNSDDLMYSWRDLFNSSDKKAKLLGRYLLYYSYITSGFRGRMFSFHNYIPPTQLHSLEVVNPIDHNKTLNLSFNEFIRSTRQLMKSDINYFIYSHLVDETIINNWYDSNIVPRVDHSEVDSYIYHMGNKETDDLTGLIIQKSGTYRGKNVDNDAIFTKFLTINMSRKGDVTNTYLLKYVGYIRETSGNRTSTKAVYKVVPKKSFSHGGFVIKEYMLDQSIIPSNNVPYIHDGEEINTFANSAVIREHPDLRDFVLVDNFQIESQQDTEQRNISTGEFVQAEELNLPDIMNLEFTKGKRRLGENITSNADGLAFALTNPTLSTPKGFMWSRTNETKSQAQWREYFLKKPFIYKGKTYVDAEQAYQQNKIGIRSTDTQLMLDIMIAKLHFYPDLVKKIDQKGGRDYLTDSTHTPTGAKNYWESTGLNAFIKLLTQAYITVKGIKMDTPSNPIEPTPTTPKSNKPTPRLVGDDYVNNSGGAIGADSQFDIIGRSRLFKNHKHYYMGDKTPMGNTEISKADAAEGQRKVTIAAREMGRIEPTHQVRNELLIRNWAQVKYSEGIFAVSTIIDVVTEMEHGKIAKIKQVKGGTGYAVQMGINEGRKVFVYDQDKKQWFKWDYDTKDFVPTTDPILTKTYAGIGTRQINEDGRRAIAKLYDDTKKYIEEQKDNPIVETKPTRSTDIYEQLGSKTVSEHVKLEPWSDLKDAKEPINYLKDMVVSVVATRVIGAEYHFGNPFSPDQKIVSKNSTLIKVDSIREAVEAYIGWILGEDIAYSDIIVNTNGIKNYKDIYPKRREWILEQLKSGKLKGKAILYYTELNEPSHATALDYLINKYDWGTTEQVMQDGGQPIYVKQIPKVGDVVTITFNINGEYKDVDARVDKLIDYSKADVANKGFDVDLTNIKTGKHYGVYVDMDGSISQFEGKSGIRVGTEAFIADFNMSDYRTKEQVNNILLIQPSAPVQLGLFDQMDDEFPFIEDENDKFSTNNKPVQDIMNELGIENWADVTKEQMAQIKDKYKICK